jgi:hypothetical protein
MPALVMFTLGALAGAAGALRCPEAARKAIAVVSENLRKVAKTCLGNQESSSTCDHRTNGRTVIKE